MTEHEAYEILCALATTGQLTERESRELADHCASCRDCRRRVADMAEIGCRLLASKAYAPAVSLPRGAGQRFSADQRFGADQRFIDRARLEGVPLSCPRPSRLDAFITLPNLLRMALAAATLLFIILPTERTRNSVDTVTAATQERFTIARSLPAATRGLAQKPLMPFHSRLHPRPSTLASAEPTVAPPRFVFYRPSRIPDNYAAIPVPPLRTFVVSFVPSAKPALFQRFDSEAKSHETRIALLDRPQRFTLGGQLPEPDVRVPPPHLHLSQLP